MELILFYSMGLCTIISAIHRVESRGTVNWPPLTGIVDFV